MGLRGYPCFTPLVMVIDVESPSSVLILTVEFSYIFFMMSMVGLSNPARSIMVSRVVCGIDLNAS